MTTYTSMDKAIDVLFTIVSALPEFAAVEIADGFAVDQQSDMIVIGVGADAVSGTQAAAATGAARTEDYDIKCLISCWTGGYLPAEQAKARRRAIDLLRAVETAIRGVDGGPPAASLPVGGVATVMYAELVDITYGATLASDAAQGRWADVGFSVRVQNYLY